MKKGVTARLQVVKTFQKKQAKHVKKKKKTKPCPSRLPIFSPHLRPSFLLRYRKNQNPEISLRSHWKKPKKKNLYNRLPKTHTQPAFPCALGPSKNVGGFKFLVFFWLSEYEYYGGWDGKGEVLGEGKIGLILGKWGRWGFFPRKPRSMYFLGRGRERGREEYRGKGEKGREGKKGREKEKKRKERSSRTPVFRREGRWKGV